MTLHSMRLVAFAAFGAALALHGCASDDVGADSLDAREQPIPEGSPEALAVLALVNDRDVDLAELNEAAGLQSDAAASIIAARDGADALPRTADDTLFALLAELDALPNVGPATLRTLLGYARGQGYLDAQLAKKLDVIFSPNEYADSHLPRVAQIIDGAARSIDIAMYSFSDAGITQALERAVDRGVKVRFVFETAGTDKSKEGAALGATKSASLEKVGVNVRYVSKIMHHKLMIVDGPRDDLAAAESATVVTGSGNWSNGAATRYDENTLFFSGYPELVLRLQREFDLLWDHSGDFVYDATLPYEHATASIEDLLLPEDPTTHVWFTSANFRPRDTTWGALGTNEVSDRLAAAIGQATRSIHIASGHLRSRPVAEALMAKVAATPGLDVRVLLDSQEYISQSAYDKQVSDLDRCLEAAGDDARAVRACVDKGFYFGYAASQAGIPVRYKYYAYRWNAAYAPQMHNKVLIIDGDELFTGSYNLSDNAEHNTFENMFWLRGPEFAPLIARYEATFERLWELGRAEGMLAALRTTIETASSIPIVFDPIALEWQEITDLKSLIRMNCPAVDSAEYRQNPTGHMYCPRP